MAIPVSSLIYVIIGNESDSWINEYLNNKGLSQECSEDIEIILEQAIERQFSHKDAYKCSLTNMGIFDLASKLLDDSKYSEGVTITHFFEEETERNFFTQEEKIKHMRGVGKVRDQVIAMLSTLSKLYAEDARVQESITLHNTWYYILGLSFAAPKRKPYPLPTLGQARKLTRLVNDTWPVVSKRFPEMFIGRKRPDFEADNPTISRQMRSGYKEGLSLRSKKQP